MYNFSLSNSLEDIQIAIYARIGEEIDLEAAYWEINRDLHVSIKHLMNKHRVIYSMTTWIDEGSTYLAVNMRANDKWFLSRFIKEKNYPFADWSQIRYARIKRRISEMISKLDNDGFSSFYDEFLDDQDQETDTE